MSDSWLQVFIHGAAALGGLGAVAGAFIAWWIGRETVRASQASAAEGRQARENAALHNRIQMRPNLRFSYHRSKERLQVLLTNKGAGPALISSFEVFLDRNPVNGPDPMEVAVKQATSRILPMSFGHMGSESALSPGEQFMLLSIDARQFDDDVRREVAENLRRIDCAIRYSSVYEESFELNTYEDGKE